MKFISIIGPQAVGKMTVGEELSKLTGIKLFHNHVSIEFVLEYMSYGEGLGLIQTIREGVFEAVSKGNGPGLIFTFIWDFDSEEDWKYVEHIHQLFQHADRYYVELYSDLETRVKRNGTENRLTKKASKRDVVASTTRMVDSMDHHRMNSRDGEFPYDNYIKIDNTNISAKEVAQMIYDHFELGK